MINMKKTNWYDTYIEKILEYKKTIYWELQFYTEDNRFDYEYGSERGVAGDIAIEFTPPPPIEIEIFFTPTEEIESIRELMEEISEYISEFDFSYEFGGKEIRLTTTIYFATVDFYDCELKKIKSHLKTFISWDWL